MAPSASDKDRDRWKEEPGASLVGPGPGASCEVTAPGAVVRGLIIRGSGTNLGGSGRRRVRREDRGGAIVENNRLEGNLYGICLHGAPNASGTRTTKSSGSGRDE